MASLSLAFTCVIPTAASLAGVTTDSLVSFETSRSRSFAPTRWLNNANQIIAVVATWRASGRGDASEQRNEQQRHNETNTAPPLGRMFVIKRLREGEGALWVIDDVCL